AELVLGDRDSQPPAAATTITAAPSSAIDAMRVLRRRDAPLLRGESRVRRFCISWCTFDPPMLAGTVRASPRERHPIHSMRAQAPGRGLPDPSQWRVAGRWPGERRMPLRIVAVYGSVRADRQGIRAARFIVNECRARGHEVTLVDPIEYRLPLLDKMYKEYP